MDWVHSGTNSIISTMTFADIHTVLPGTPSRTPCRPALRSRLLQADLVYFQVSKGRFNGIPQSDPKHDASVALVVGVAATAECREFWQLVLCQGFLVGVSCGMAFGATPTIISHWFKNRRSMAFGIAATGTSIGGTAIPIASSNLIELVGYAKGHTRNRHNERILGSNGRCGSSL